MSEAILSSQLPTAASLSGLNVLVSDSAGSIKRVAASLMLGVYRSLTNYDLNDLKETGLYGCGSDTTNAPGVVGCNGSYVLVLKVDGSNVHQLMFHRPLNALFYRQLYVGVWGEWQQLAFAE